MSFEVRYNRDGEPIKDTVNQPTVQVAEEVPDIAIAVELMRYVDI